MVQTQLADAFDGVVVFPLLGGAVAARREEPMQHAEKDGSFDGKLKTAVLQQSSQHRADRAGLPESLEDQRRTDPGAARGDALLLLCHYHDHTTLEITRTNVRLSTKNVTLGIHA